MTSLRSFDPEIADAIAGEIKRQAEGIELIARERHLVAWNASHGVLDSRHLGRALTPADRGVDEHCPPVWAHDE